MIVCDNCLEPVTIDMKVALSTREDPHCKIDWCPDCARFYKDLCAESSVKLKAFKVVLAKQVDADMKRFMESSKGAKE